jgi:hypothetical protein
MKPKDLFDLTLGEGWQDDRRGLLFLRTSINVERIAVDGGRRIEYVNIEISWDDDGEHSDESTNYHSPWVEIERRINTQHDGDTVFLASHTFEISERYAVQLMQMGRDTVIHQWAAEIARVKAMPDEPKRR